MIKNENNYWNCDDDDSNDDNMVGNGNGGRGNGAENIVDDRYPANANDNLLIWTYHLIFWLFSNVF